MIKSNSGIRKTDVINRRMFIIGAAKVVVFMPPPVPPGLAPMNIKVIKSSNPESEILSKEIGIVVKPAVLALTEVNRAVNRRSSKSISDKKLPLANDSVKIKPKKPREINMKEDLITKRV